MKATIIIVKCEDANESGLSLMLDSIANLSGHAVVDLPDADQTEEASPIAVDPLPPVAAAAVTSVPAATVTLAQPSSTPAAAQTSPAEDKPGSRASKLLVCNERAGRTFTIAQAAELAGVSVAAMYAAVSRAAAKGQETIQAKAFTFRRAPDASPHSELGTRNSELSVARPRHANAESMPINTHRIGSGARGHSDTTGSAN